ncbi:MAG: ankyrin repeat domain-containing protein, partial [Aureliella sp.]
ARKLAFYRPLPHQIPNSNFATRLSPTLHVHEVLQMGKRVFEKANFYLRRGNRKRLKRLFRKRAQLLNRDNCDLVYNAIWQAPSMLPWLLKNGVHPDSRHYSGDNTPLMQAAADDDVKTMKILLEHGADPNSRNSENELPLGFACSYQSWDAARLLVHSGADVNGVEDENKTHLDWLVLSKDEEGIHLLRGLGGKLAAELEPKDM